MALLYVRTGNGGADAAFAVPDLGVTVPTGASWTLLAASSPGDADGSSGQFTAREIRDSSDLTAAVVAGDLEWSTDGVNAESGSDYVADWMIMQDFTDDFMNLTDGRFALPNDTSLPASGIEGESFWNSDADSLYVHDGSDWLLVATASGVNNDHGSLTGLTDDDHSQYLLLSGDGTRNAVTGTIDMSGADEFILPQSTDVSINLTGHEGALAWDTDDETLYAHDGTQWFAIAPASGIITDHGGLTGLLDDDHTQYLRLDGDGTRNDVTGRVEFTTSSGLRIPNGVDVSALYSGEEEGDIAWDSDDDELYMYDGSQWVKIGPWTSGDWDHGSLTGLADDDHPQYTEWNNTETVSGLWTFDTADSDPSFILDPKPSAPTTNLADGGIAVVGDILYAYDATRTKWLSVDRATFVSGRRGASTNIYLRVPDTVASSVTGYRMLRDGTITGIWAQTESDGNDWTFEVHRNGSAIATLSVTTDGNQATNINVDVSQGDELQFYCNGTAIPSPVGGIEVAWRV